MADLPATLHDSLSKLITANHILDHYKLVDAFGHISLRNPSDASKFYMTGQQPPAFVSNETDFAHYHTHDGAPVIPNDPRSSTHPFSEEFCHSGTLKRHPSVNCVVHSHSPDVIAVGVSGVPLKLVYHMAGFMGNKMPVFNITDVYDDDTGPEGTRRKMLCLSLSQSQGSLPDRTVVLQRGHGFCTWGDTIEQAVWRAIYTQQNAQIQMSATDFSVVASGELKIQPLAEQEIKDCAMMDDVSATKAWMYWSRVIESNLMYRNDLLRSPVTTSSYRKTQTNRMEPF